MQELKYFGIPVGFEPADSKLVPMADDVAYEDTSRKFSKGMFGLLADAGYSKEDEPYYDFYKAICSNKDRTKFSDRKLRFDSTVIMAGTAGKEFKKTAGHFHCMIPGSEMSFPELYQVIKGTAVFVMQKVDDSDKTDGKMVVQDCILAEVHAGETIIIPPGYGHCTVNVSDETMVFINLVSTESSNAYGGVKASQGMCCYVMQKDGGGFALEQNPRYEMACTPRLVTPLDNQRLGLTKGEPAYVSYLNSPETFDYLNKPEGYTDDFMAVFQDK